MAGRTRGRGAVVVATAAACGLLAGCAAVPAAPAPQSPIPLASAWHPGLFVAGHGPEGLGPSASTSASAPNGGPSDADQQQLAEVGLLAADVGGGESVALAADGTSLAVPTLSYCAGSYPSEKAREARRKVQVVDSAGNALGVSTEAVLYRSAPDAALALTELRAAVAACPARRSITFQSHDLVLTSIPSTRVATAGLVATPDRELVSTEVHDVTAGVTYQVAGVYQVRGRVLSVALLSSAGSTFTAAELDALHSLAQLAATRLGRLDPAFAQAP